MNNIIKFIPIDIVFYHGGCPDGIAASWLFWRENQKINHEAVYKGLRYVNDINDLNIDVTGKNVIMVDYTLSRDALIRIHEMANYFLVIDHHDSSERSLEGLDFCIFDKSSSAVQIVWDYLYTEKYNRISTDLTNIDLTNTVANSQDNTITQYTDLTTCDLVSCGHDTATRPWFVDAIADRDLWIWSHPNSKEYTKAMYYDDWYKYDKLEYLFNLSPEETEKIQLEFIEKGKFFTEIETKDIENAIKKAVPVYFEGYLVKTAYCPSHLRSEVGNRLAGNECHFALLWQYDLKMNEWWISMRAPRESHINLSKIAEKFGGGGHEGAASFSYKGTNGTLNRLCQPINYKKISKNHKIWYHKKKPAFITRDGGVYFAPPQN